ncbi:hypothetical protein FRC02_003662 [Tulasnella sp. 418]|nr:hypothetical protein FRC02_003662 [Tulasnella sp. 418]
MASTKVFTLNDGHNVPAVGLGCWMGYPGGGEDAEQMVKQALKLGYRHFDTAYGYGQLWFVPPRGTLLTGLLAQTMKNTLERPFESLISLGTRYF